MEERSYGIKNDYADLKVGNAASVEAFSLGKKLMVLKKISSGYQVIINH